MEVIQSDLAPAVIGVYSQAIRCGDSVYLSGQIPLNPKTRQLCSDEIAAQIEQVFSNLTAVCNAAGGSLANLVKITVYLTDLSHYHLLNEIMAHYFTLPYPARAVIGVNALPLDAKIEVEGIMKLTEG